MAGGEVTRQGSVVRRTKTSVVRAVVPQSYQDIYAGMGLYGRSLDARDRGFPEVADRMKAKAGDWMQGNRVQPGSSGNFSGNAVRTTAREVSTWPPTQTAEDVAASVSRNAAGAKVLAERSLAATVLGDAMAAAPKALKVMGRALPATAALLTAADLTTGAIGGGMKAYEKGGDALDVAKGAGWGAINAASIGQADVISDDIAATGSIALGLEKWAGDIGQATLKTFGFGMSGKGKPGDGKGAGPGRPAPGKVSSTDRFNQANKTYANRMAAAKQPPTNGPQGNGMKGFQIPKVQAAAQRAKGNNYTGPEE